MKKRAGRTVAWTPSELRAWRDLIAHLDTECSGAEHISVHRRSVRGDDACAHRMTDGSIRLFIAPKLRWSSAIDALIHEYAHVLAGWRGGARHEIADHNDLWGVAYATVYRAFLRWQKGT